MNQIEKYYNDLCNDLKEVMNYYPYTKTIVYPYSEPNVRELKVIAVNREILQLLNGKKEDFVNEYSKEIKVIVPYDYKTKGCKIYGGKWINESIIPVKDRHFYSKQSDGTHELCIGVPQSFSNMNNQILESIKTAENILLAYEFFQNGKSNKLELHSYSHGGKGINEFEKERKKYTTKHRPK